MKNFFKVVDIETVLALAVSFQRQAVETVSLMAASGRVLAQDVYADLDIPGFSRSTMDGYALRGASTFGASEGNPAFLRLVGNVAMGEKPEQGIGPGEAVSFDCVFPHQYVALEDTELVVVLHARS